MLLQDREVIQFRVIRKFGRYLIGFWLDGNQRAWAQFIADPSWRRVEIRMHRRGPRQWSGPAGQVANADLLDILEDGADALQ